MFPRNAAKRRISSKAFGAQTREELLDPDLEPGIAFYQSPFAPLDCKYFLPAAVNPITLSNEAPSATTFVRMAPVIFALLTLA